MGTPLALLVRRVKNSRLLSSAIIGGVVLLVAGTVGVADASTTYNGCENLYTGVIRLLPSQVPPPYNATCNTTTTSPYLKEQAISWSQVGPQGPIGPRGLKGDTGLTGATGPQGPQGLKGDTGLTGAQGLQGIQGLRGADGKTVLNGNGGPTNASGNAGDFYIDTAANVLYGPKSITGWPVPGVSLIGEAGAQGLKGDTGPAGPAGPQGPQGAAGTGATLASLDSLGGIPCTIFGGPGVTSMLAGSDGTISFHCTGAMQISVSVQGLDVAGQGIPTSARVTSAPRGIDCGSGAATGCTQLYPAGINLTLIASAPAAGWTFGGWQGVPCTAEGNNSGLTCTFATQQGSANASAVYVQGAILNLTVTGAGCCESIGGFFLQQAHGVVTASPGTLQCSNASPNQATVCVAYFAPGTSVTLAAAPDSGFTFTSWTGDCSGAGLTCTLTMDSLRNVTATFGT